MAFDWTPLAGDRATIPAGRLVPDQVLYAFDGPVIFSTRGAGQNLLCFKIDEDESGEQFLVAPTNQHIIGRLKTNSMSMRSALAQAWLWVVEADHHRAVRSAVVVDFEDLPDTILPFRGIGLSPSRTPVTDHDAKPFLSIHFKGASPVHGMLPYGVVVGHLNQVFHSLWRVFAPAVSDAAPDASERALRQILSLPVYQPGFSSLLIELGAPQVTQIKQAKLDSAAAWTNIVKANDAFLKAASLLAREAREDRLSLASARQMRGTLDIVATFVPNEDSFFDSVSIYGTGENSIEEQFSIDATAGTKIRHAQNLVRKQRGSIYGVVMEVNGISNTFILRDNQLRQTTCVPTTYRISDVVRNLKNGMYVEVGGAMVSRAKRDKLFIEQIAVDHGKTVYAEEL